MISAIKQFKEKS